MSAATEPVRIELLRRIGALVAGGSSNTATADTLRSEGYVLPRDGAADNRLAPASGYNINNGVPGDPGRWTAAAVAAIRASQTFIDQTTAGFPGAASVALTL